MLVESIKESAIVLKFLKQINKKYTLFWVLFLSVALGTGLFYYLQAPPKKTAPPSPVDREMIQALESVSPLLKPSVQKWQRYLAQIKAKNSTLTYAEHLELVLSTVGENTWYIKGQAGIYEDATQRRLMMRNVQGRLEAKGNQQKEHTVLSLSSAFADYDAQTERLVLRGRSRVTIHP
jgi:hypothetical protein